MGVGAILSLGCEWAHSSHSSFSYPEAIPTMGEGTHSVYLSADDGLVIRVGIGNVSAVACQTLP